MDWLGRLGLAMSLVGAVAVVLELLLLLTGFLRLTKRLDDLTLLFEDNLRLTRDELRLLSRSLDETQVLLRPFRRVRKWLLHPVTLALYASYRRRRMLRRAGEALVDRVAD